MIRVIKQPVILQTYVVAKLCDPHSRLHWGKKRETLCSDFAESTGQPLNPKHKRIDTANAMQRWTFFLSGGHAVLSLSFTWPHVAAVSIIPALPFQISMSNLLMQEYKHSGNLHSMSMERTLICMNTYSYTFLFPPPHKKKLFSAGLSLSTEYNIHHMGCTGRRITHFSPYHGQIALDCTQI